MSPSNIILTNLNSDYPIDMIALMTTATGDAPSYGYQDKTIAHGLPFKPLVAGTWSLNAAMSPSYPYNGGPADSYGQLYNVNAQSDSTNITLFVNNNTASAVTVYHEIFAFAPNDYSGTVVPTANAGNKFIINSDDNFGKLFVAGNVALAQGAVGTIPHNLGFVPQAFIWRETSTGIVSKFDYMSTGVSYNDLHSWADSTNVYIGNYDFLAENSKYHYRIYANA